MQFYQSNFDFSERNGHIWAIALKKRTDTMGINASSWKI